MPTEAEAREYVPRLRSRPLPPRGLAMPTIPHLGEFPDLPERPHVAPRHTMPRTPAVDCFLGIEQQHVAAGVDDVVPRTLHRNGKVDEELLARDGAVHDVHGDRGRFPT